MKEKVLLDALVEVRRIGGILDEILDISRQLAEAVDRNDQVSIQMLLSMRGEPIGKLRRTDQALRHMLNALPDREDARRLAELLNGGTAQSPQEKMLTERVAANARMLRQVVELDEILNRRLTREKSVYNKGAAGGSPAGDAPRGSFSGRG